MGVLARSGLAQNLVGKLFRAWPGKCRGAARGTFPRRSVGTRLFRSLRSTELDIEAVDGPRWELATDVVSSRARGSLTRLGRDGRWFREGVMGVQSLVGQDGMVHLSGAAALEAKDHVGGLGRVGVYEGQRRGVRAGPGRGACHTEDSLFFPSCFKGDFGRFGDEPYGLGAVVRAIHRVDVKTWAWRRTGRHRPGKANAGC